MGVYDNGEIRKILDSLREDSYLNPTIMRGELRLIISRDETEDVAVTKTYGIVIKQLEKLEDNMKNKVQSVLESFFKNKIKSEDLGSIINEKIEPIKEEYIRFRRFGEKLELMGYGAMLEKQYGKLVTSRSYLKG